jgi:hypothetical protein
MTRRGLASAARFVAALAAAPSAAFAAGEALPAALSLPAAGGGEGNGGVNPALGGATVIDGFVQVGRAARHAARPAPRDAQAGVES